MRHGQRGKTMAVFHHSASFLLPFCPSFRFTAAAKATASSKAETASALGNLLIVASIAKTLSKPGGIYTLEKDGDSIPLSEDLVLQVLRRGSLDASKKLDFFRWCSVRPNYKHSVGTYSQMFKAICFLPHQHHEDILELVAAMRRDGVVLDSSTLKLILDGFIRSGKYDSALEVLDYVERDLISTSCLSPDVYSPVLVALVRKNQISIALSIFLKLLSSSTVGNNVVIIPDAIACNELLVGLKKAGMKDEFKQVFGKLRETKLFRWIDGLNTCALLAWEETVVYNSLLDGLLKSRKLTEACNLFEKMVDDDGVRASCWTYNILIDGLYKNGRAEAAYTLFSDLKRKGNNFVDGVSYSIVVLHLCREGYIEEALQLVEEMEARGFVVDLVTITSLLIAFYRRGQWDSMERLMKHVRDGNLVPLILKWKSAMEGSMKGPQSKTRDFTPMFPSISDVAEILNLPTSADTKGDVEDTEQFGNETDEWSSSPYMDMLANKFSSNSQRFSQSFSLSKGVRVMAKDEDSFDIDMVNTYLSIFLAKGKLSLACKLFEIFTNMGVDPVSYTYNSIMSSFVKRGYFKEAWGVLHAMGETVNPADIATYNVIIQGLGKMGRADLANAVLDKLVKEGGYLDIVMYNTLINALGKAGRIDEANKLFQQMKTSGINPDVVTYNTLIEVHSKAGRLKDAYKVLKMMLDAGCAPNHVTDTILDFLESEIERLRYKKASIMRSNTDDAS
ncbi:hypothetical protein DH2020_021749 [Rehmannia glutinosa]|uniref:Pentatricopeptide repeat-containing protein n=1 Tax=Rehmannia glutinosa TaxID=99300 RepID=A0ABR0WF23_REHGL